MGDTQPEYHPTKYYRLTVRSIFLRIVGFGVRIALLINWYWFLVILKLGNPPAIIIILNLLTEQKIRGYAVKHVPQISVASLLF